MSDHGQRALFSSLCGTGAVASRTRAARWPTTGQSPWAWPTEPSFAEMVSDPVFQQLMASDRVSMEKLNGLVAAVRQRLAG